MGGLNLNISYYPSDSICFGSPITLTASSSTGFSCSWYGGAVFSPSTGSKTVSLTFVNPGNYLITCVGYGPAGSGGGTVNIVVLPNPSTLLNITPKSICINTGTVQLFGGSPIGGIYSGFGINSSGVWTDSVSASNYSMVQYKYKDQYGCEGSAKDSVLFQTCTGISEFNIESNFSISPNPAIEEITINSENIKYCPLKIYDSFGRIVKEVIFSSNEPKISISDLQQGIYYVSIENLLKQKFVKQ